MFFRRGAKIANAMRPGCRAFAVLLFLLSGCTSTPQTDKLLTDAAEWVDPSAKELIEVPFYPQEKYQCGPAALATVLGASYVEVTPEQLVDRVYVPGKKGSFQLEMLAAARRHQRIPYELDPQLSDLIREVAAGNPVLVLQNLGPDWYPQWHYAVVVGYDMREGAFVLRSGELERRLTPFKVFENTWRRSNYWGVVALKPGDIPATAGQRKYFLAVSAFAERGGDNGSIQKALLAGVKQWPENRELRMGLANHYYSEGQLAKAGQAYRGLIDKFPGYAPAHNNLALVLLELGKVEEALEHANQAVAIGGRFKDQYLKTLQKVQDGSALSDQAAF